MGGPRRCLGPLPARERAAAAWSVDDGLLGLRRATISALSCSSAGSWGIMQNQILLIKTAWGGKSLYKDFRPPSSGGKSGHTTRRCWRKFARRWPTLRRTSPATTVADAELAGFVWYQGWNDGCEPETAVRIWGKPGQPHQGCPEGPERAEAAFVIGELTGPWVEAPGDRTLPQGSSRGGQRPEFQGNVAVRRDARIRPQSLRTRPIPATDITSSAMPRPISSSAMLWARR